MRLAAWCGVVLCLAAGSLLAASPAGAVAGYGDVAGDRYYTEPVQWSVDNDITGIDGDCFLPDEAVSRGEAALYIWNMEGQPAADAHSFTDVTVEAQNAAISWIAETKITYGSSETTFSPGVRLTRGQIAAFLHRLADKPDAPPHPFVDVVARWQQAPVSWMATTGITNGTSSTTFSPDKTLTRAQLVTFLWRYQDKPDVTVDPGSPVCDPRSGERKVLPAKLALEMRSLVEIAQDWDQSAQVAIAVVLPDGSVHGVDADKSVRSASAVKPLWTAAAIEVAGLEAVNPFAYRALALSDNYAAGEMIDLAGGVDSVNAWTGATAGLEGTHLAHWSYGSRRLSSSGNRPNLTTMRDLALFYARLHQGELLEMAETVQLESWLLETPRRLRYVDGALVDRLPLAVAAGVFHKTGWLPPGCCSVDARLIIDAGLVVQPNGEWFGIALSSSGGRLYNRSVKWVGLAACQIYVVVSNHLEHTCGRQGDPPINTQP